MIYLVTGVPGSGKTLYCVSTLLAKLASDQIVNPDGSVLQRRLLIDGIPSLKIPHELLDETVISEKSVTMKSGGDGVGNWWEWCKPGDVIVIDEVQRIWRPRANGVKPPQMITELETHRHKGVDFVLVTQNPMLIDQNVRRLVGRHQHVRRLFGMARAMIYDWDGCQVNVSSVAGASKTMWSYPKNAFSLYQSAQAHTKQHQKIPLWMVVPVLAIVGGIFAGPMAYAKIKGTVSPVPVAAVGPAAVVSAKHDIPPFVEAPLVSASVPVDVVASVAVPVVSEFAGCVSAGADVCRCYDADAKTVVVPEDVCLSQSHPALGVKKSVSFDDALSTGMPLSGVVLSSSDIAVITSMVRPPRVFH